MAKQKQKARVVVDLLEGVGETTAGLRHPPQTGELVFSLRMHVEETKKDAKLALEGGRLVLSEASALQPGQDFGWVNCQTCTLFLSIESVVSAMSGDVSVDGNNVKVKLGKHTNGKPMIIISS